MGWRLSSRIISSLFFLSSKPTVWDGDKELITSSLDAKGLGSKPTVWDGDFFVFLTLYFLNVLSPLCGMETALARNTRNHPRFSRFKPTVWDGDRVFLPRGALPFLVFQAHCVG